MDNNNNNDILFTSLGSSCFNSLSLLVSSSLLHPMPEQLTTLKLNKKNVKTNTKFFILMHFSNNKEIGRQNKSGRCNWKKKKVKKWLNKKMHLMRCALAVKFVETKLHSNSLLKGSVATCYFRASDHCIISTSKTMSFLNPFWFDKTQFTFFRWFVGLINKKIIKISLSYYRLSALLARRLGAQMLNIRKVICNLPKIKIALRNTLSIRCSNTSWNIKKCHLWMNPKIFLIFLRPNKTNLVIINSRGRSKSVRYNRDSLRYSNCENLSLGGGGGKGICERMWQ